jgi:hypothetical protein
MEWKMSNVATSQFFHCSKSLLGQGPPHCWGSKIIFRHTTLGRTSLGEWSARSKELYLKTHNTHIHAPSGIPTRNSSKWASANRRLNRAAAGIGLQRLILLEYPRFYRPFVFWFYLVISSMAQQPLVGKDSLSEVFTITIRYTTLGRTPVDEW